MKLLLAAMSLGACTGAIAHFEQSNLVSDGTIAAAHIDPNLKNPWGISLNATGPFWIANNGTGTSTLYDGEGTPFPIDNPLVVHIMPAGDSPTGTVFNPSNGFRVGSPGMTAPALFMFASEEGRITGWNPMVDPTNALVAVDNSMHEAVYKGMAIARHGFRTFVYVTNFHDGVVEVYDSQFRWVANFTDPRMESGFAPFGIQRIGQWLVVTYAKQDADRMDDVPGPGNGFVVAFNTNGHVARRLISHGELNSPWGIARSPNNFGEFNNSLLIGNFGDGKINAFKMNGHFAGTLTDEDGKPLVNEGLWALSFGNGALSDEDDLYFTAGPGEEQNGLFGEIEPAE